jgi:hypothetical protein
MNFLEGNAGKMQGYLCGVVVNSLSFLINAVELIRKEQFGHV